MIQSPALTKSCRNTLMVLKRSSLHFVLVLLPLTSVFGQSNELSVLKEEFKSPPATSAPGVYWYFMDGNLSREEMTKDLESMKMVGISNLIFLEVGIGVPRGPVDFMSEEWQDLYVHAVREAERLGIKIALAHGYGRKKLCNIWYIVKPKFPEAKS